MFSFSSIVIGALLVLSRAGVYAAPTSSAPTPIPVDALITRADVTALSTTTIASYKPYTLFARAAYCNATSTATWKCGPYCDALPGVIPYGSGGDGTFTQYWFVGYDPLNTKSIVVGHQGTHGFVAYLTDANFALESLDSSLFPGISSSIKVHDGFKDTHKRAAPGVLAAVKRAIAATGATKVTIVGHSLGGAIALLDAVYLPLQLPSTISFTVRTYGLPRVGNAEFANYVDTHVTDFAYITSRKDLVPVLPPRFFGYVHPEGEKHIVDDSTWVACAGHDNTDTRCSTGAVPTIFNGNGDDHGGPYDGINLGDCDD